MCKNQLPTPIEIQPLISLLQGYNDISYIKNGFQEGFHLGYIGDRSACDSRNLKSCMEYPEIVERKLEAEKKHNRIAGPFEVSPFDNLKISPIGVVEKKTPGQYRLIHHLSYPAGSSVNDFIDPSLSTVSYTSFDDAVNLLIKSGGYGLVY